MDQIDAHIAYCRLAAEVLDESHRQVGVQVAIVDALAAASAVLAPAIRGAGGHYFDLQEIARDGLAVTDNEPWLVARIASEIEGAIGSTIEIRDTSSGRRQAAFVSDPVGAPADDLRLATATCGLAPALREPGLVVVAYDESGVDLAMKEQLWTLVRSMLGGLLHSEALLLVLCATDRVDYGRMCGNEPSGRLFVSGNGPLTKRNAEAQDVALIRHLASGHTGEHLVLFLGAGFSASSGLALGNELRDIALAEYLDDDLSPPEQLPLLFYEGLPSDRFMPDEEGADPSELASQLTLERVLRELTARGINPSKAIAELERKHTRALTNPGAAVRHLDRIVRTVRRKIVLVTVNFDQLAEQGRPDRVKTFATDADFSGAADYVDSYLNDTEPLVPLLKVHGSLGQSDSLVFNLDETTAGLPPNRIAALARTFAPRHGRKVPIAYVGASMRDRDLTLQLTSSAHVDNTDEYWIAPLGDPSVVRFWDRTQRVDRWRSTHRAATPESRFITRTADDALDRLAAALGV
jgi:SIR2-like domain